MLYAKLFKEVFPSKGVFPSDYEDQISIMYKTTFNTDSGKKVLNDLVLRAKVFGSCNTEVEEGARRFVLDILTTLTKEIKEE